MNKNGFAPVILVLIVTGILVVGSGLYVKEKSQNLVSLPPVEESKTSSTKQTNQPAEEKSAVGETKETSTPKEAPATNTTPISKPAAASSSLQKPKDSSPTAVLILDSKVWEAGLINKFTFDLIRADGFHSVSLLAPDGSVVAKAIEHWAFPSYYPATIYVRPPQDARGSGYMLKLFCETPLKKEDCGTTFYGPIEIIAPHSDPIVASLTHYPEIDPNYFEINGRGTGLIAAIWNRGTEKIENVEIETTVRQGETFRLRKHPIYVPRCILETNFGANKEPTGTIPPAHCTTDFSISANDAAPTGEPGTFTPGPATLEIVIKNGTKTFLRETRAINLSIAPPLSVHVDANGYEPSGAPFYGILHQGGMIPISWTLVGKLHRTLSLRLVSVDGKGTDMVLSSARDSGTISDHWNYLISSNFPIGKYKIIGCDVDEPTVCAESKQFSIMAKGKYTF
ncbi:MAG: hypothetical protein AAB691_04345 [Patescibacteria group bacterium]